MSEGNSQNNSQSVSQDLSQDLSRNDGAHLARGCGPYRPDVDGLRAIAVGAVVFHHLGFSFMAGGFLGVDIFFVISGFLIATIVRRELQSGSFSIARFYERRVRRIFPALMVMLLASAAVGWLVLPPPDLVRLSHSLSAAVLFVANFHFWGQGGYYDAAAQSSPLLHLWSLGVEEQFYLAFPWLLMLCRAWIRSRQVLALAFVGGVSLVVFLWLGSAHPSAAFYLIPFRAWELLLGALVSFLPASAIRAQWLAQGSGWVGLGLLAAAVLGFAGAVVPAAGPLAACLGAALVIVAGLHPQGLVGRVLSVRPLVFVGLISYSLYLWHWPVLVYYKAGTESYAGGQWLVLGVSLALAVLSWAYVEQPARRAVSSRRRVVQWAAAGTVMLLLLALFFSLTQGGAWRFSRHVLGLYAYDSYPVQEMTRQGQCFLTGRGPDPSLLDRSACLSSVAGKDSILLAGDSHAAHLWSGLAQALPELTVLQATASACRPLLSGNRDPGCALFVDEFLGRFVASAPPSAIILAARWSEADIAALTRTVAILVRSTPRVIVLGPAVEYREALPRLLARAERLGDPGLVDRARVERGAELDRKMQAALQGSGASYVSLYQLTCPPPGGGGCRVYAQPGVPLQFDYGHLTREGSVLLARQLRPEILGE